MFFSAALRSKISGRQGVGKSRNHLGTGEGGGVDPVNSNEVSDYGINDPNSLKKKITAMSFFIKSNRMGRKDSGTVRRLR